MSAGAAAALLPKAKPKAARIVAAPPKHRPRPTQEEAPRQQTRARREKDALEKDAPD